MDYQLTLNYFEMINKTTNLTNAAKLLHISQPYLSQFIARQEIRLGTQLFNRGARRITLNESGQAYLAWLKDVTTSEQGLYQRLQLMKNQQTTLRIGVNQLLGEEILPRVVADFKQRLPQVTLQLFEQPSIDVEKELLANQLDIYLGMLPLLTAAVEQSTLYHEHLYLVVPENSPLYQDRRRLITTNTFDFQSLNNLPFISLLKETNFQRFINQLYQLQHVKPHVVLESASVVTAAKIATTGIGHAWIHDSELARLDGSHNYNLIQLDPHQIEITAVAAYSKNNHDNQTIQSFIEVCQENLVSK